jgi:hypothetical protein
MANFPATEANSEDRACLNLAHFKPTYSQTHHISTIPCQLTPHTTFLTTTPDVSPHCLVTWACKYHTIDGYIQSWQCSQEMMVVFEYIFTGLQIEVQSYSTRK